MSAAGGYTRVLLICLSSWLVPSCFLALTDLGEEVCKAPCRPDDTTAAYPKRSRQEVLVRGPVNPRASGVNRLPVTCYTRKVFLQFPRNTSCNSTSSCNSRNTAASRKAFPCSQFFSMLALSLFVKVERNDIYPFAK